MTAKRYTRKTSRDKLKSGQSVDTWLTGNKFGKSRRGGMWGRRTSQKAVHQDPITGALRTITAFFKS